MKSYLISDNRETLVGMRLAGIEGEILSTREKVLEKLEACFLNQEIGIVILTEHIYSLVEEEVSHYKLKRRYPLIVEIPDRHGQKRGENYLTKDIKESVGIKLQ